MKLITFRKCEIVGVNNIGITIIEVHEHFPKLFERTFIKGIWKKKCKLILLPSSF